MATVGIWKIKSNLYSVINYATNKEKTNLENYSDLIKTLNYVETDYKTEKKLFVDGINCNPNNALKEMVAVKKKFMKTDGILAFHAYHSFKEGEVTPEVAHKIGLEVANEMWGDRFQVIVTTHLDRKHLHNHFVINSVSFIDGKRYYDNRTNYAELRRISNVICSEHGLSTLEEKKTKAGLNYLNYQQKNIEYTNYYKTAKRDLDIAIHKSKSYNDFLNNMKLMDYTVYERSGKLSIRNNDYKRNIRIERYFGIDYSIDNIKKQIKGIYIPIGKNYYKNRKPMKDYLEILTEHKYKSFYGMYIRYCNILNNYPRSNKYNYISKSMRDDIDNLENLSKRAILLAKNNIKTEEDFLTLLNNIENKIVLLQNAREDNYKKIKNNPIDEKELVNNNKDIATELYSLKEQLKMLEEINKRKNEIKESLEKIEEKEMIIDEHIR